MFTPETKELQVRESCQLGGGGGGGGKTEGETLGEWKRGREGEWGGGTFFSPL